MRKAVNIGVVALEELGEDLADTLICESTVRPSENGHARSDSPHVTSPMRLYDASRPSDEQRRYLFRLLAERGIEADEAWEYIHRELGVASFHEASRRAVSALIDRLKNTPLQARPVEASTSERNPSARMPRES